MTLGQLTDMLQQYCNQGYSMLDVEVFAGSKPEPEKCTVVSSHGGSFELNVNLTSKAAELVFKCKQ